MHSFSLSFLPSLTPHVSLLATVECNNCRVIDDLYPGGHELHPVMWTTPAQCQHRTCTALAQCPVSAQHPHNTYKVPTGCCCCCCLLLVICLLFYILATSKVISGWVPACRSDLSLWPYSPSPLRDQTTSTITRYRTPSHYPDAMVASPLAIILIPNARLDGDRYKLDKSVIWLRQGFPLPIFRTGSLRSTKAATGPVVSREPAQRLHNTYTVPSLSAQ